MSYNHIMPIDRPAPVRVRPLTGMAAALACAFALQTGRSAAAEPDPARNPDNPRYVYQSIGDDVGLGTRGANTMMQDRQGFVWIGTSDGLFRCDGADVVRFDQKDGLADSYVSVIEQSPDGAVWVVAGGRVSRFDGSSFVPIEEVLSIALPPIDADALSTLDITRSNIMYAATSNGLWRIDLSRRTALRSWSASDGLPADRTQAVHADAKGLVWVAANNRVVALHPATGEIETYEIAADLRALQIRKLLSDGEGRTWLATRNHLLQCKAGSNVFEPGDGVFAEVLMPGAPNLDRRGDLLVPTDKGLYYKKKGRWVRISADNGLRISSVTYAMEDREGDLWIGLLGAGVQRRSGSFEWTAWTSQEGLPDDTVWAVFRDVEDRLWVGTNKGIGVWVPGSRAWKIIEPQDGLLTARIAGFAAGPDGRVWSLSRRTGLNRFDPHTLIPEMVPVPREFIGLPRALANAPDGSVWVASAEALFAVRARQGQLVFEDAGLPPEIRGGLRGLSIGSDGIVWTCGEKGLGRFDGTSWSLYGVKDGLLADELRDVLAINGTQVWVSYKTAKGVTRLTLLGTGANAEHFDAARGLASDRVFLLEADRTGKIWIGGPDGVSVLSKDGAVQVFDRGAGLIWNDINRGAFWADPDGSVFIGTPRGLAQFNPFEHGRSESPPKVVITSAQLGRQPVLGESNPAADYAENTFTVKYAGLTFRNPSKVRYTYRLIGWDGDAVDTRQREVRYAALPPGQYRFEVWCCSAAGLWSDTPAVFFFRIVPPWWQRWWARLGAAAALIAVVLAILWLRTRKLRADRARLEAAVTERNAQLARVNEELEEMSFTDALTKTRNRRFFSEVIDADIKTTLRKHTLTERHDLSRNRDLLFFIIDLDHFKKINDIYGHAAGDALLVETARRLKTCLRESDLLIRWGGEEFLILCRETDRVEGLSIAKRILEAVGTAAFQLTEEEKLERTCSLGWAAWPSYETDPKALSYETVLELTDKGLYLAKKEGRNRAVGIELLEDTHEPGESLDWLDEPLEALEDRKLRLIRVRGPRVSVHIKKDRMSSNPP